MKTRQAQIGARSLDGLPQLTPDAAGLDIGAEEIWALPFLTALCPSERYHQQRGQRHETLSEWAGQLIGVMPRWLPGREVVVVALLCGARAAQTGQ